MKGTTEELIWFIVNEYKKRNKRCSSLTVSHLLLYIEGMLMNYLSVNSVLKDTTYVAHVLNPTKCESLQKIYSSSDLVLWLDDKEKWLAKNFKRQNSKEITEIITRLIDLFAELDPLTFFSLVCDEKCPIKKYELIDEKNKEDYFYHSPVPKEAIALWCESLFTFNEETDEDYFDEEILEEDEPLNDEWWDETEEVDDNEINNLLENSIDNLGDDGTVYSKDGDILF